MGRDKSGGERWFEFSDQPGTRIQVGMLMHMHTNEFQPLTLLALVLFCIIICNTLREKLNFYCSLIIFFKVSHQYRLSSFAHFLVCLLGFEIWLLLMAGYQNCLTNLGSYLLEVVAFSYLMFFRPSLVRALCYLFCKVDCKALFLGFPWDALVMFWTVSLFPAG